MTKSEKIISFSWEICWEIKENSWKKKYFLETQVNLVVLRASIEPSYARTHSSLPYIKK